MTERTGLLLVNLGSPRSPSSRDVGAYLREFLSDPFVIDVPAPVRMLLVRGLIVPFRAKRSAAAYRSIWTERGSPLAVHTADLAHALGQRMNTGVRFAMRYGSPSIEEALQAFRSEGITRIHAVPLYPQFAGATTGTVMAELYRVALKDPWRPFHISIEPAFYGAPGFASLWAGRITEARSLLLKGIREGERTPEQNAKGVHILFSFHGLPVRQILRSGTDRCMQEGCCEDVPPPHCYRAQCLATARSVAGLAGLTPDQWSVSFQSRLGRSEWLAPSTEERLGELAAEGQGVLIAPLSFVADCLETLEELGIRGKHAFASSGGYFRVLPSLNGDEDWVGFLQQLVSKKI